MKKYVVGIVFDSEMFNCLMLLTNHGPYPGKLNGVGGKIEEGELPIAAMEREFTEETGISPCDVDTIEFMVRMEFPSKVELHVYYIKLKDTIRNSSWPPMKAVDEGHLIWIATNALTDASYGLLAGEGNVAWFVNYALILEGRKSY